MPVNIEIDDGKREAYDLLFAEIEKGEKSAKSPDDLISHEEVMRRF